MEEAGRDEEGPEEAGAKDAGRRVTLEVAVLTRTGAEEGVADAAGDGAGASGLCSEGCVACSLSETAEAVGSGFAVSF